MKSFLAGKRGICPHCGVGVDIPTESTRGSKHKAEPAKAASTNGAASSVAAKSVAAKPVAAGVPKPIPAAVPVPSYGQVSPAALEGATVSVQPSQPTVNVQQPAGYAPLPNPSAPRSTATPTAPAVQPNAAPAKPAPPTTAKVATPVSTPANVATPVGGAVLAPDPIAEAPNAVWYVRPPSGGQFGPAKGDIMRKWIGEGRVSADSLVWREGWPDWKTAGPIFPTLARSAAVATPIPPTPAPTAALPANPLSQPLTTTSSSKTRAAKPKNSNTMALVVVVLLALISVILLVVFIVVASGKLFN